MEKQTMFNLLITKIYKLFFIITFSVLFVACNTEEEELIPEKENQEAILEEFLDAQPVSSSKISKDFGGIWLTVGGGRLTFTHRRGEDVVTNRESCVYNILGENDEFIYIVTADPGSSCSFEVYALPNIHAKGTSALVLEAGKGFVPWLEMTYVNFECVNNDITAPSINCGIIGTRTVDEKTRLKDYRGSFKATDDCSRTVKLTQSPAPGTLVRVGRQTVTITASDYRANKSSCRFTVNGKAKVVVTPTPTCKTAPNISTGSSSVFGWALLHPIKTDAVGDEYEWTVSGNGHVGYIDGGFILRNRLITKEGKVDVFMGTGNGKGYDSQTPVSSSRKGISITLRVRRGSCWSEPTKIERSCPTCR